MSLGNSGVGKKPAADVARPGARIGPGELVVDRRDPRAANTPAVLALQSDGRRHHQGERPAVGLVGIGPMPRHVQAVPIKIRIRRRSRRTAGQTDEREPQARPRRKITIVSWRYPCDRLLPGLRGRAARLEFTL